MGWAQCIARAPRDNGYGVLPHGHDAALVVPVPDFPPEPAQAEVEGGFKRGAITPDPAGESYNDVDAEIELGKKAGNEEDISLNHRLLAPSLHMIAQLLEDSHDQAKQADRFQYHRLVAPLEERRSLAVHLQALQRYSEQDAQSQEKTKELQQVLDDLQAMEAMPIEGTWHFPHLAHTIRRTGEGLIWTEQEGTPQEVSALMEERDGDWLQGTLRHSDGQEYGKLRLRKGLGVIVKQFCPNGRNWGALGPLSPNKAQAIEIYSLKSRNDAWDWLDAPAALPGDVVDFEGCSCTVSDAKGGVDGWIKFARSDGELVEVKRTQYGIRSPLPRWAYATEGVSAFLPLVIGPMIPWLRALALVNLATQICMLAFAWSLSKVEEERTPKVSYPMTIWLAFLPALLLSILIEISTLKRFLVPYVITTYRGVVSPFEIIGVRTRFEPWLLFAAVCSGLLSADIASDSIFTGTTLCLLREQNSAMEKLWDVSWERFDALHWTWRPRLYDLVCVSWLLSLVQLVWPVISTWRRGENCFGRSNFTSAKSHERLVRTDSDEREDANDTSDRPFNVVGSKGAGFTLLGRAEISNDVIALAVSDAACLASISSLAIKFQHATIKGNLHVNRTLTTSIAAAADLGQQLLRRITLTILLETCLQLYVQSEVFAIRVCLVRMASDTTEGSISHAEIQQLASLVLSILTSLLKAIDTKSYLSAIHGTMSLCDDDWVSMPSKHREFYYEARRCKMAIIGLTIIMGACSLYTAAKVALTYHCTSARFSFTNMICGGKLCLEFPDINPA